MRSRPLARLSPPSTPPRALTRVLVHIEHHLDEDLRLESLAKVAKLSRYHFHRQFRAQLGLTVTDYVKLRRLERASYHLAFRPHRPVLEVALDSGYEGPEAFARAFKRKLGQSPSAFRKQPRWDAWHTAFARARALTRRHLGPSPEALQVHLETRPETPVALLAHRGDPRALGDTLRAFITWRREHGLPPSRSATYNVLHDDPEAVAPEAFRMDVCAATERAVAPNAQGVVSETLAGGRYAVLRHVGPNDTLGASMEALYRHWLPASGETLRDAPLLLQRVKFYPDVPAHEAVTDILLPLA